MKANAKTRLRVAWAVLAGVVIAWPLTALTIARDEPQVVLGLSFLALAFTAWNIVQTADVRKQQDDS